MASGLKKGGRSDIVGPTPLSIQLDTRQRLWIGYPGNHLGLVDGEHYREFGAAEGVDLGATLSFLCHAATAMDRRRKRPAVF